MFINMRIIEWYDGRDKGFKPRVHKQLVFKTRFARFMARTMVTRSTIVHQSCSLKYKISIVQKKKSLIVRSFVFIFSISLYTAADKLLLL